jgi:hypothetical protein
MFQIHGKILPTSHAHLEMFGHTRERSPEFLRAPMARIVPGRVLAAGRRRVAEGARLEIGSLQRSDAHQHSPTHWPSTTSRNDDVHQRLPVNRRVCPGFRGVCDTVLTQNRSLFKRRLTNAHGLVHLIWQYAPREGDCGGVAKRNHERARRTRLSRISRTCEFWTHLRPSAPFSSLEVALRIRPLEGFRSRRPSTNQGHRREVSEPTS